MGELKQKIYWDSEILVTRLFIIMLHNSIKFMEYCFFIIILSFTVCTESFLIHPARRVQWFGQKYPVSRLLSSRQVGPRTHRYHVSLKGDLNAHPSNSGVGRRVLQNEVLDEVVMAATRAVEQSTGEGTESGGPGSHLCLACS